MILNDSEDTIVALATPAGEGAIAVIRLSGPQAIPIAEKHFRGRKLLSSQSSHTVQFGKIIGGSNEVLDEVVCTVFRAPHSYTGEDVIEISCHGGLLVTRQILDALTRSGARLAQPGEFTKRAFLNGKMDLSQAEAVADLIQAQSGKAHKSSIDQLSGKLSKEIRKLRDELAESLRMLELELDFVEEDIQFVDRASIHERIQTVIKRAEELILTYNVGKVYREGVKVAIIGEPNVGKSSLLNALLNQDRAIVTHIPGTTRDFIEESIIIEGILFRLIDTAGLRNTDDPVEKEGVKRTEEIGESSDIILIVCDAGKGTPHFEESKILEVLNSPAKKILVINKIDINSNVKVQNGFPFSFIVKTSALNGEGIEELKQSLVSIVFQNQGSIPESSVVVTNQRHIESLRNAKEALERADATLQNGASNEFVAVDLRAALDYLGEIVGAVTTEEILNGIFSKFCIGK